MTTQRWLSFLVFLTLPVLGKEQEQRGSLLGRNGEVIAETSSGERVYPLGELTAHLSGYLVKGERGVTGLEKAHDQVLASGKDVTLTVDLRLQKICTETFPADKTGAVIILDPSSGAVLALASFPAFDPNDFVPAISQAKFESLTQDARKPLHNRAIHPSVPGSIYKLPVALAVAASKYHDTVYGCRGGVLFGEMRLKCWKPADAPDPHGSLDLRGALLHSCNAWFYQAVDAIGIAPIDRTTRLLGLQSPSGCGLPGEGAGYLPTREKRAERGQPWQDADVAMVSIGQGEVVATPLQVASMAATFANGGKVYSPHLLVSDEVKASADLTTESFSSDEVKLIREAMRDIVNDPDGTAGGARSEQWIIAGKSASAMTARRDVPTNAWFVGFAPYEEPTLAICVLVEDGRGNRDAAPVAKSLLEKALTLLSE